MATVGEKARIIKDLISSEPSNLPSKGDPSDERANCGVDDLTDRACGDEDRMGNSAVVADRGGVGEDPERASASSASIECVDSASSGYLDLEVPRATPGEKDGGGLTGVASPGDVMDSNCFLRNWA